MNRGEELLLAYLLDLVLGDPPWLPHPVVGIGRVIGAGEALLNRPGRGPRFLLLSGAALTAAVVLGIWGVGAGTLAMAGHLGEPVRAAVSILLLYTALAGTGLARAGEAVRRPLAAGDLDAARGQLARYVGRRTEGLPAAEVARGAVETVAENTVDGFLAPLFYGLVGGAPLALAYKAVNTLDSMLGYHDPRHRWFGRAADRLDDAANYLPARLGAAVMLAAGALLRLDVVGGVRAVLRDARRHPSPNAGYPEAAAAGLLGVRLGGENRYADAVESRPCLGAQGRAPDAEALAGVVALCRWSALLGAVLCAAVGWAA